MKDHQSPAEQSNVIGLIAAAVFASFVGFGTLIAISVASALSFPKSKTALIIAFMGGPVSGLIIGRLCYAVTAPVQLTVESNPGIEKWRAIRNAAIAFQLITYFSICIALGTDLHIFARQFRDPFWYTIHFCLGIAAIAWLISVYKICRNNRSRIALAALSLALFTMMYASFLFAANWLADPLSIPTKLLR